MSFEEEFDSIMRQKSDGADFPFDEKAWAAASGMIDERNSAARRKILMRWVLPSALILVLGVSAYLLLAPAELKQSTASLTNLPSKNMIDAEPSNSNNISETTEKNTGEQIQNASKALTVSKNSPANETIKKDNQKSSAPISTKSTNYTSNDQIAENTASNTDKNNSPTGTSAAEIKTNSAAPSTKEINGTGTDNNANIASNLNLQQNQETNNVKGSQNENSEQSAENTNPQDAEIVIQHLVPVAMLLPINEELNINNVNFQVLPRYNDDYVNKTLSYFGLEAGGAYSNGWAIKGSQMDGKGMNLFAGVFYGLELTSKHSVQAGLQYFNVGHISTPYYVSEGKSYGFGYTSSIVNVTAQKLHLVNVPIKYAYQFNKQLKAGLGINASYVVAAKTSVSKYGVSDGAKGPVTSLESKKIFDGTNSFGFAGSMFVSAKVSNRFYLNAEMFFGLSDLFKNYGTIKYHENSTTLRLGLNYIIVNK